MTDKDDKSQSLNAQNQQDSDLWAEVTRDVEPLKGKSTIPLSREKRMSSTKPKGREQSAPLSEMPQSNRDQDKAPQSGDREMDARALRRLKRGQMTVDGRIDLHGKSQNQAYDALLSYIPNAYAQGKRCILVVTGKGHSRTGDTSLMNQKPGILKQKTPEWLNTPPLDQYVLKVTPARPQHGGEGALYVLLRRRR